MSNQEQQKHEPAESAPQVPTKSGSDPKPRKRRGFFSQLFSHLMVAVIAVIGVSAFMHWRDVLQYTGARVCSYNVLGKYATQPPKVPPIGLSAPANEKSPQAEKSPAKETPETKAPPAPKEKESAKKQDAESFNKSLEVARKLFWTKDPTTPEIYEKLTTKYPDNADLRAELGNVYYKFGKTDEAMNQYFQAGKLFVKQKNTTKASEMVKILEKIVPEKARELNNFNAKKE